MNTKDVQGMFASIWPAAVAEEWLPAPVLTKLCGDIARMKLDAAQVEAAMLEHCTRDAGAGNKPVTAKLMARLGAMVVDSVNTQTGEVLGANIDDFIAQQRRIQAQTNPDARDQPAWKILAAWFDQEYTNRHISHQMKLGAGKWVHHALKERGAGYNDAVYAAASIYNLDPVELDQHIQDSLLVSRNSRMVSQKALAKIGVKA